MGKHVSRCVCVYVASTHYTYIASPSPQPVHLVLEFLLINSLRIGSHWERYVNVDVANELKQKANAIVAIE